MTPQMFASDRLPAIDPELELALQRLADDGNPNHEYQESREVCGVTEPAPPVPANPGSRDVENSEATVRGS